MLKSSKKNVEPAANKGNAEKRHDHASVAQTAYFLAEKRGFAPGADLEDWYAAEEIGVGTAGRAAQPKRKGLAQTRQSQQKKSDDKPQPHITALRDTTL